MGDVYREKLKPIAGRLCR